MRGAHRVALEPATKQLGIPRHRNARSVAQSCVKLFRGGLFAGVLVVAAGACSSGHARNAAPSTAPAAAIAAKSAAVNEFCDRIGHLTDATGGVGIDARLADVRRDFPELVNASRVLAAGALPDAGVPPASTLETTIAGMAAEAPAVNTWVQTSASQHDLDANVEPSDVAGRLASLRAGIAAVERWSTTNCPAGPD